MNLTVRGHKAWWGLLAICLSVLSASASSAANPAANFSVLFAFDLHNTAAGVVEGTAGPAGNNVGVLFGTTYDVSLTSGGTIYKVSKGGGAPEIVYQFKETDGYSPQATLLVGRNGQFPTDAADGYLYGATVYAPRVGLNTANGSGTIFKIRQDGTGFTTLHTFDATGLVINRDGMHPTKALIQDAVYLYGVTAAGGANATGTVFRVRKADGALDPLYSFPAANADGTTPVGQAGTSPSSSLTLSSDGQRLYGVTSGGGVNVRTISSGTTVGTGTIYSLNVDGTGLQVDSFDALDDIAATLPSTNATGAQPVGGLVELSSGVFIGTASTGGTPTPVAPATTSIGYGTLFKYIPANSPNAVTPLYNFDNVTSGASPAGSLVVDKNNNQLIYGETSTNLYSFDLSSNTFTVLHAVSEVGSLNDGLIMASDGDLYGTGASGSACTALNGVGYGAVFRFSIGTGASSAGYSSCTPVSNSGGGAMSPGLIWLLALLGLAPPVRRRVFGVR